MAQDRELKATSIIAMYKMIHAFFSWYVEEEYIKEGPMEKVECPKLPKTVIHTFKPDQVYRMIHAFNQIRTLNLEVKQSYAC